MKVFSKTYLIVFGDFLVIDIFCESNSILIEPTKATSYGYSLIIILVHLIYGLV